MKCTQCGKEFKPKRSTAKYCSPKCRVYANRKSVAQFPTKAVNKIIARDFDYKPCKHGLNPKLCKDRKCRGT